MTAKIPCAPFGKKMKITMVEQDIPQQGLVKRLGIVNPTASDIIYSHNRYEHTKKHITETLGIKR